MLFVSGEPDACALVAAVCSSARACAIGLFTPNVDTMRRHRLADDVISDEEVDVWQCCDCLQMKRSILFRAPNSVGSPYSEYSGV